MIRKNIDVSLGEDGARPIAMLVQLASQYVSNICLLYTSGCYSSVCVASPLWYVLSGKGEKEQKAVTYSKKKK